MGKVKRIKAAKRSIKAMHTELEQKLTDSLSDWKESMGEKKFAKRIKKAVKVFGKDLKITVVKKIKTPKKKTEAKVPKAATTV